MMSLLLLDLPSDGPLVGILAFLDAKSLLHAASTCRTLRQLAPWQAVEEEAAYCCSSKIGRSARERLLRFLRLQHYTAKMERLAFEHYDYATCGDLNNPNSLRCSGCSSFPDLNLNVYNDEQQRYEMFVRLGPRRDDSLLPNKNNNNTSSSGGEEAIWEGFVPVLEIHQDDDVHFGLFRFFLNLAPVQKEIVRKFPLLQQLLSASVPVVQPHYFGRQLDDPYYQTLLHNVLNHFTVTVTAMQAADDGECSLVIATGGYHDNCPSAGEDSLEQYYVLDHRNPASHETFDDSDSAIISTVAVWIKIRGGTFCGLGIAYDADE